MRRSVAVVAFILFPIAVLSSPANPKPDDRARVRRTASDLKSLAIAVEHRASETYEYPAAKTLDELSRILSPKYINPMPRLDGWGHPVLYLSEPEQYRIVSAGPDGKFSEASKHFDEKKGFGDDIVFELGQFIAVPDYIEH